MWANGATGLLNANSLNSLKTAISGLSKEQALLVLSTKNLSKAQTEQVLSAAGLLNVEKQLTTAQISERLAKKLNSKADAEALLINSGLITQKELEENATIKVTAAKINEAVANGTLSASDASVIAGALGITGVNTGATISFDLLTASIWANIKALGAWLVTTPIGWVILGGTAIFGLVKAYDALTDSVEEVKERTDALLETYNSAISEANSNAQTIESLASRYEKLSKGVNNLGENVSLTADEYSEYNDIVNQIADMFPTMITGYTDEGNAILSLKGNVEELRDAYKEAQKEAYNLLIISEDDIITNYQNQVHGNESWLSKQSSYIDGEAGAKDAIEIITRLTGALTPDEFRETYNQLYEEYKNVWNSNKIQDALKSSGFEEFTHAPKWSEITIEDLAKVKYSAQATIQTYNAEIESQLSNVRKKANAYLMTNSDYEKLDEQSKTAASILVNSINENIADEFSSNEDIGAYVGKLVTSISDNDEVQNALKDLFTMDSSDMPVGDIAAQINEYINSIAIAINEDPEKLKIRLGFDYVNDLEAQYQRAVDFAKDKFDGYDPTAFFKEHSINTQEEIDAWQKIAQGTSDATEAEKEYVQSSTLNDENPISITPTISSSIQQLATQLEPQFAKLGEAYKEIFTDDGFTLDSVDNSMLENLRKSFAEIEEEVGVTFDSTKLEPFFDTLINGNSTAEQVQQAFNDLASSYLNSTDTLEQFNDETANAIAKQLELMGITNAQELVDAALLRKKTELIIASDEYTNASDSEKQAMLDEIGAGEALEQIIAQITLQKQLANTNALDTTNDINAIYSLAKTAGFGAETLYKLAEARTFLMEAEASGDIDQINEAKEAIRRIVSVEQQKLANFSTGLQFASTDTSKTSGSKSSSSAKDTTDTFDWIQQAIENVEKEIEDLDDIVNSAYSTFSQKNDALAKEIGKVSEEIDLQQQAYDEYMRKADSIGLSDHYRELVQNGTIGIEDIADESLQNMIDEYQKWYDKAMDASNAIKDLKTDMKDLYVSAYELQTDNLKDRLDSNSITEKQYLDELKATYERFYADLEDFAQQYHEAVLDYLDKEKNYLNSVTSAAASLLDREIDNIRDDADAQESSLKRQIDLLEAKKKPLQDELDALEDKARKEELIYNLQKAQYALARAENQRTKLVNNMPDTIVI